SLPIGEICDESVMSELVLAEIDERKRGSVEIESKWASRVAAVTPRALTMEYSPATAEYSQSLGRQHPFRRAFAAPAPRTAHGRAIAQQQPNHKIWVTLWQKKRL